MKEYKFEEKFYWNVLQNYVDKYLEVHMYKSKVHPCSDTAALYRSFGP